MKKIFLDTNFIFDCFIRPEYKEISEKFLYKAALHVYELYISYLTVANYAYILRKEPDEKIYSLIKKILDSFLIIPNNRNQIENALILKPHDFEDALQYQAAVSEKCDFIITRNKKDFEFSVIPVLSADEFLFE